MAAKDAFIVAEKLSLSHSDNRLRVSVFALQITLLDL